MTLSVDHIHHLDRQMVAEGEEHSDPWPSGCQQSEFRFIVSKRRLRPQKMVGINPLDS